MAENDRFSEETELMKSPCVASELTLRVDVVAQTFGVLGIGKWATQRQLLSTWKSRSNSGKGVPGCCSAALV
jgi:hypothetical protein